ncbi:MAG: heme peroxidase family protein [Herpetosiphon sp.]
MATRSSHDLAHMPDVDPNPDVKANAETTIPTTTPTDQPAPGGTRYASAPRRAHGTGTRGENLSRQSPQFEGRFGRMFRTLPGAAHHESDLRKLADAMTAQADASPTPETEVDDEENTGISAGYTYVGQFIDHDLTFDPASSLQRQNDPDGLTDYRTPRFDLDCLYGRGPDDQPYLYANDGVHMLLGRAVTGSPHDPNSHDVPRNTPNDGEPARGLLGDPRNDENLIVSQLQSTMLRFHNCVVDYLTEQRGGNLPPFEVAQRAVRYHYQWMILHDFLPTIIGIDTVASILPPQHDAQNGTAPIKPRLHYYTWRQEPYIPVEFSVAAYRFGHSMVRPIYRLNTTLPDRIPIFGDQEDKSLVGFRRFPDGHAVDWNLFFKIDANPPSLGPDRVQPAYKIDTSLVNPLAHLPASVVKTNQSLPYRNLVRGLRMSLPSGQAVARAMRVPVILDRDLKVGKATEADNGKNRSLTDVSSHFAGNAPLWYYILAEAQQAFQDNSTPLRLGPVGGRIVGEVFVGLMYGDPHSYMRIDPDWHPFDRWMEKGVFGMAQLIKAARG